MESSSDYNNVKFKNTDVSESKDSDTGTAGDETMSLGILNEFKELYEKRIADIDPNDDNKLELKIKIMREWIENLEEQNKTLVHIVYELEEASSCKVKMLEEQMKHLFVLSENMSSFTKPSQQVIYY